MKFIKGNGYWADKHYWIIKYEGEYLYFILFGSDNADTEESGSWTVWSDDSNSEWYEDFRLDEHTKEIAQANVDICVNCGRTNKTIFGKTFGNVCRTTFRFDSPDVEMVECAKRLVKIRVTDIIKNHLNN